MIAIIPARGGSKGLKNKNVKLLNGKPLIAYTIEAALNSKYIDEVIVSTESPTISDISLKFGAKQYFSRPIELASDNSLAIDTYLYTINRLVEEFGFSIDSFLVLLPTSPLRTSADIDNAIELFKNKNADSVISYTKESHPISWHRHIDELGHIVDIEDSSLKNRQDLRTTYYPNGAIYIFKVDLIKAGKYYSKNTYGYIMPRERSVDIDDQIDFDLAEFFIKRN